MSRRLDTERFGNLYNTSISVSFQVMIGASDLEGYARTVVTLALFSGKRVDVTVSGGLAELLRLNSSCPVVSASFGVRKSESHRIRA